MLVVMVTVVVVVVVFTVFASQCLLQSTAEKGERLAAVWGISPSAGTEEANGKRNFSRIKIPRCCTNVSFIK